MQKRIKICTNLYKCVFFASSSQFLTFCLFNITVSLNNSSVDLQFASSFFSLFTRNNQSLKDEISELSRGNKITEALAREELGLVKNNEQFFRVIDKDTSSKRKEK